MASSLKSSRINLRASASQSKLIRRAAEAQSKSVSEFILDSACRSAEEALFDLRLLRLDGQAWEQFVSSLDRRAKEIPELVRLFREKALWD